MAKYNSSQFAILGVRNITSFNISYKELMAYLDPPRYFVPEKNIPESELTEEQELANSKIESISLFNAVVHTSVFMRSGGMSMKYDIDDHLYDVTSVNGLNLVNDFSAAGRTSVALYNIRNLYVSMQSNEIDEQTGEPKELSIPEKDRFLWMYIIVETPEHEFLPLYIKVVQVKVDEDDQTSMDDIDDEKNDFVITDKEIFDDYDNSYNDAPDSSSEFDIKISEPMYEKYTFINSTSLYELHTNPIFYDPVKKKQILKTHDNCIKIKVDPCCMKKFTISLNVSSQKVVNGETVVASKTMSFEYVPSILETYGNAYKRATKMNLPNVSYALLRTNPKLTGNIKVVVDSNNNLYLDTFKVSTTLSQRRYRHIKVDANNYYGQDLMLSYSSVPSQDFYKVEDKCYSLFTTAQSYNNQYYDLYYAGVKTNDDKMYSENFAMLAPLCVKDVVPDFFLIFKIDKTLSDYSEDTMSDTDKLKYFIKNGKLVKSYDMRQNSVLGQYVRNIAENAAKEVGDLFVSYETTNYDKFIGISLDRGVVTSIYETPFKREYVNNQVSLNEFYTRGFERNHLVSKNIVNFEFMFNDTSSELFSIDTYFGLYVKVNTQEDDFSCIGKTISYELNNEDSEVKEIPTYQYNDDVNTFPSYIINLDEIYEYSGLIYGVTTPTEFIRLNTSIQDSSINENFLLKPYRNISATTVRKIKSDDCVGFLTIKFNRLLEVGDHLRIIDKNNLTIYEILLSNVSSEYNDSHDISDDIKNYYADYGDRWKIYRVSVHIPFRRDVEEIVSEDENPTMSMFLSTQVEQIFYALRKFNVPKVFTSWKYNEDSLSIVSYVEGLEFERICSPSGFTDMQKEYLLTHDGENDTLEFFGSVYPAKTLLIVNNDLVNIPSTSYLYPYNFKLVGNRIGYCIKFLDLAVLGDDYVYYGTIDSSTVFDTKSILYKTKSGSEIKPALYSKFDVTYTKNLDEFGIIKTESKSISYAQSYNDLNSYFFNVHSPFLQADTLLLYDLYPINSGVCSIFNIKDFDFDVLDADSILSERSDDTPVGTSGEYTKPSIFNVETEDIISSEENQENSDSTSETLYDIDETVVLGGYALDDLIYNRKFLMPDPDSDLSLDEEDIPKTIALDVIEKTKYSNCPVVAYDDRQIEIFENLYALRPFIKGKESHAVYDQANKDFNCVAHYIDLVEWCTKRGISGYRIFNGTYEEMKAATNIQFRDNALYVLKPVIEGDGGSAIDPAYDEINHYVYTDLYGEDPEKKFLNLGIRVGTFEIVGKLKPDPKSFVDDSDTVAYPIRNTSEENIKDYIDKYRSIDSSMSDEYSLYENSSNIDETRKNYYEALINNNHTKLDVSLISPYTCKWKSVGTDARGENLRIMYDYIDSSGNSILNGAKSYFCVGAEGDLYNRYLGFMQYIGKNKEEVLYKKYITRSLNMHTYEYDSSYNRKTEYFGIPYKNSILEGSAQLDDILYDSKDFNNKFSVTYLSGDNTIEFISGGVKFRIKSNNDNAINLSKYKGYNAVFVSIPDINVKYSKQTELIIDETTKELMFIWYQPANTFRFGATLFNSASDIASYDTSYYPCRIDFYSHLSDIACTYIENTPFAKIPDDNLFSEVQEYDSSTDDIRWKFKEDATIPTGKRLCDILGFIYIDTIRVDDNSYTKNNNIVLTGRLYDFKPVTKYLNEKYAYYLSGKYIYTKNPILWHNEYNEDATITAMNKYCYDYSESINAYLYTDDPKYIVNNIGTYNKLKNAISSCCIYIKSYEGTKDYTKLKDILSISVIDPIKFYKYKDIHYNKYGKEEQELGYVHSTYAEPVMKDMITFGYTSYVEPEETDEEPVEENSLNIEETSEVKLIDNIFKISFDGANTVIKNVNTINQIWLNKYTDESNFCIKTFKNEDSSGNITYNYDANISLDVRKNVSIMSTSWSKTLYRKYFTMDTGRQNYDDIAGYTTGYEMKTFINSRGINLNGSDGKSIEIVSWKNTEISDEDHYIKLDVTDSIIYHILFRHSYVKSWRYLKLTNNTHKINYIKNTILPFININNKTKFVLYKGKRVLKSLHFDNDFTETFGDEIINYKNELKYENGKYFMYVYPEEYTTYSAKMIINI